jgi:hypothetical protein
MKRRLATACLLIVLAWPAVGSAADRFEREFDLFADGEAIAVVHATCPACDWGEPGREAAVLTLSLDGKYSQHVPLVRGGDPAGTYPIALGIVGKGHHTLAIERDPDLSAPHAAVMAIDVSDIGLFRGDAGGEVWRMLSMAPIVYARPNTVGKFTDVPLLMWCEIVPTKRGHQYRYSVIFSNEDGGTQTDRLMATWGRTTDIEFIYGAEVDSRGQVIAEEFQGPGHEVPAFKGQHEDRHPLVWVSTDNNMVSESGPTKVRYRLQPQRFDLTNLSREEVMDRNPWSYAIASVEMRREGKIEANPEPGHNAIADPRRFVYLEACGAIANAALSISIGGTSGVRRQPDAALVWTPSDRGRPEYRIVRDGCFRIATPLPAGTRPADIRAIRVYAYDRPAARSGGPAPGLVNLTRINKVFMLDESFRPERSILHWEGSKAIPLGGEPFEVAIP